jgi:hypothetical protein
MSTRVVKGEERRGNLQETHLASSHLRMVRVQMDDIQVAVASYHPTFASFTPIISENSEKESEQSSESEVDR